MDADMERVIRNAVAYALDEIGLDVVKRGPFFGIGERRKKADDDKN